ncbi:GyrI-like domain-containing protein [Actinoplanes sp. NPDC049599]|uniref:GyrI-like domain-containing protein n=1 Tax=Actinoplanes sp. NPDC049599 TaxID=3363903 RepID=UPI0037923C03
MTYHIETRSLTAQPTAVIRSSMPVAQLRGWLAGAYQELDRYLAEQGISAVGPPFARYAFHGAVVDVEAGFPVPGPVPDSGRWVTASRLPAGPVAVAVHEGHYQDLGLAYQAVTGWLKERGLEPAGPHWDVYYTNLAAQPDTATWRTDVVAPYRIG